MDSARCDGTDENIPPPLGSNQIAGFVDFVFSPSERNKFSYLLQNDDLSFITRNSVFEK